MEISQPHPNQPLSSVTKLMNKVSTVAGMKVMHGLNSHSPSSAWIWLLPSVQSTERDQQVLNMASFFTVINQLPGGSSSILDHFHHGMGMVLSLLNLTIYSVYIFSFLAQNTWIGCWFLSWFQTQKVRCSCVFSLLAFGLELYHQLSWFFSLYTAGFGICWPS